METIDRNKLEELARKGLFEDILNIYVAYKNSSLDDLEIIKKYLTQAVIIRVDQCVDRRNLDPVLYLCYNEDLPKKAREYAGIVYVRELLKDKRYMEIKNFYNSIKSKSLEDLEGYCKMVLTKFFVEYDLSEDKWEKSKFEIFKKSLLNSK
ncbi:MAG: hypothetical protein RMJ18_02860 [Candidatus Aenigmarchaeota archaeon]|nr:hypothetical protein [Candidatus Aenigmarchaeota archaeon]MCX8191164.1 hypothetical protein [Candidatus Aenigmarchaeota archaeon]MDW8160331.1 hypothetical protein [Candidatus Aenigmarchaeota archaeon]